MKIKIITLILMLMIAGTACVRNPENTETSLNTVSGNQTSEVTATIEISSPTITATAEVNNSPTVSVTSDREIVIASLIYFGFDEDVALGLVGGVMRYVDSPTIYLGKIASEEDAKEKAENEYLRLTRDEFATNGYEKYEPTYNVKYCDEYDTWFVAGRLVPRTTDVGPIIYDGIPWIMMRGSDGKVLAEF